MENGFISVKELPRLFIKQLQKHKNKCERIEIIKRFFFAILKRKQILSHLFENFEMTFSLKPNNQIKKYLYQLKDSYDKGCDLEEYLVDAVVLFVLNNSYLCDNRVLYTKTPEKITI